MHWCSSCDLVLRAVGWCCRLVLGDIILSVDGVKIKAGSDLYRALDKKVSSA